MDAISDLPMLHDIDADYSPQYVKLALPRDLGRHTGPRAGARDRLEPGVLSAHSRPQEAESGLAA